MVKDKDNPTYQTNGDGSIRVLIVDDVKSARDLVEEILATDPQFQVVGRVADGVEAVAVALQLRPDLVTMDIRLPGIDGFEAVERILAKLPVPIVMITASMGNQEEKLFQAFSSGALDVLDKQELYLWRTRPEIRTSFLRRMRALASTQIRQSVGSITAEPEAPMTVTSAQVGPVKPPLVVAIAASTGGPSALMRLFKRMPGEVNAAFVVVQHMSLGFLDGLVRWLDDEVGLEVKKAQEGDLLEPGVVLIAPGDHHMMVTEVGTVSLSRSLPINGHRPSAILTGMGSDGAEGLKSLRVGGGHTIAQDEQSSIIFGMPRAAIELDAAEMILPLEEIGPQIMKWVSEQHSSSNH
jgi:two-component system chemotaxis response regulator CheB